MTKKTKKILIAATIFMMLLSGSIFTLDQNYPNPFNPSTQIRFSVQRSGIVSLRVFDILGKEVVTLVNENLNVGSYETDFNATGLASGAYFYRLQSSGFVETKRMVLLR